MKVKILFSLLICYLMSFIYTSVIRPDAQEKEKSNPIYKFDGLFEVRDLDPDLILSARPHPYKNVNRGKNLTITNPFKQSANLGQKSLYNIRRSVGEGTFAKVYKAYYLPTDEAVAIKSFFDDEEEDVCKEIQILRELKDAPNMLPVRDIIKEEEEDGKTKFSLVFDYFSTKSWKKYILEINDTYTMKKMIYETLRTLEYAHSRGIMHRDIKPLNVLMDPERLELRVIDWGHGDYYVPEKRYSYRVGTLHYESPDLLLHHRRHDYSVDIWSTAVMLGEIAFKRMHFFERDDVPEPPTDSSMSEDEIRDKDHRYYLDLIARTFGTKKLKQYAIKYKSKMALEHLEYVGDYEKMDLTNWINEKNAHMIEPSLIDLLEKMFVYDHTMRITAKEALEHPFFDEVRERKE